LRAVNPEQQNGGMKGVGLNLPNPMGGRR
jgi:hypothetical protein